MTEYRDPALNLESRGADAVSDITFHPTLLIGIGGTGAEVLRRVKRLYGTRSPVGERLHRFVFIDTDTRTFLPREGLPPVDAAEERCLIGVQNVRVYLENRGHHQWIAERLPADRLNDTFVRNLARGEGAGQIRSVGALALLLDYHSVFERITRAYTSLTMMGRVVEAREAGGRKAVIESTPVVYIVGSLAGGTGSGCLLDVALIARHVCQTPSLIGMFALPEVFEEQVRSIDREQAAAVKANTYAALKELQYVLDATDARADPIQFKYGNSTTLTLEPSERLFQLCYVVSNRNDRGGLSRPDELFELMARTIYQDTGSPFGTSKRVFDANCHVLSGAAPPCPRTQRPRLFSTVSTASILYPALRTGYYCAHQTLAEVIHDRLLRAPLPHADAAAAVTAFLARERLDDRGATNQILDALLTEPSGTRLSSGEFGLSLTHGQRLSGAAFVADLRGKRQAFLEGGSQLPRAERVVQENADRRLGRTRDATVVPIGQAVRAFAVDTAAAHGLEAARQLLDELRRVAQQMRREFEAEIEGWNRHERELLEQDFDRCCRQLADMGVVRQALSKKDDTLKKQIVVLFHGLVDGELGQKARTRAVDVVNELEAVTSDECRQWDALAARLRDLRSRFVEAAERHETHRDARAHGFIVERDATDAGFEVDYYNTNRLSVDAAAALIGTGAGGQRALMEQLLSAATPAALHDLLWPAVAGYYLPQLMATSVIDKMGDTLAARLDEVLEMCQPFWNAERPSVEIQFPEFIGVSTTPTSEDELSTPPPALAQWATATACSYVIGHAPYEVVISRRTYGARAAYLRSVPDWKVAYDNKRKAGAAKYMMQTHLAFEDLPDLE